MDIQRLLLCLLPFLIIPPCLGHLNSSTAFKVGVVLDMGSCIGAVSARSFSMAIDDFYVAYPNYTTRLVLRMEDSKDESIGAASAALQLLEHEEVQAILGPQRSSQAKFVAELGNKLHVPVISSSARSPSLSSKQTPYFVRAALSSSSQTCAIAALFDHFGWREAILVYEDTDFGSSVVPFLVDSLQNVDAQIRYRAVIPLSASDDQIAQELNKCVRMQTRVFVVHASFDLGSRLFMNIEKAGMMSDGYVWIATDGLTSLFSYMDRSIFHSMRGILGVKPQLPDTERLDVFKSKWRTSFHGDNDSENIDEANPTLFGLWAYDAAWALAMAAERVGVKDQKASGPKLLRSILTTSFDGLSGKFSLIDGQLEASRFEFVNVVGGRNMRKIGSWTPVDKFQNMNSTVVWPGGSKRVPRGWEAAPGGKKLRILVPVAHGFTEYMTTRPDPATDRSGSQIEVFKALFESVVAKLEYALPYKYFAYQGKDEKSNATYDEIIYQVYLKNYDAVVGDTTILANRSQYVDFTLPYMDAGVTMVVPITDGRSKSPWTFLKPMSSGLWAASGAFFVFTGFVVWVIEHRINNEFRGPPSHQLGVVFYFAFSTLVFAHKERVVSNLSKVVVIIWVFVVLILTSSYTASLTSMLTVQQLQPTVTDINQLVKNRDFVGYPKDSFLREFLIRLNIHETRLRAYESPEQYAEALSKGTVNGGVTAIFDEMPYLRVFLSKYCDKFAMVSPTYKSGGFGFVFPKGSPLVPDISRIILNVTEEQWMQSTYDNLTTCKVSGVESNSLSFGSFGGLFLIAGMTSTSALVIFSIVFLYQHRSTFSALTQGSLAQRLRIMVEQFDQKDPSSQAFRNSEPASGLVRRHRVHPESHFANDLRMNHV